MTLGTLHLTWYVFACTCSKVTVSPLCGKVPGRFLQRVYVDLDQAATRYKRMVAWLRNLQQRTEDATLMRAKQVIAFSEAMGGPEHLPRQPGQIQRALKQLAEPTSAFAASDARERNKAAVSAARAAAAVGVIPQPTSEGKTLRLEASLHRSLRTMRERAAINDLPLSVDEELTRYYGDKWRNVLTFKDRGRAGNDFQVGARKSTPKQLGTPSHQRGPS